MEKTGKGAWVIHHGRKILNNTGGGAEYSAIDIAAKSASLLARMSAENQITLNGNQVETLAKAGGLNPKMELQPCLDQLVEQSVVSVSSSGGVSVLGVNSRTALGHAADIFENNTPTAYERASLELGELTSKQPVRVKQAAEYISDVCELSIGDTGDFLHQASALGFVDHEGSGEDTLLFNGNLFRKDTALKTQKILDSLSSAEAAKMAEFSALLSSRGAVQRVEAEKLLGAPLLNKLRAAAVFDENVVSNETGEHAFMTAPGAFHKFSDPMGEDAFDQAKALVAALSYGMSVSSYYRGSIMDIRLLLGKMLRGGEVGPAPAIGQDYRALEIEGVVSIRKSGSKYFLSLRKKDVGQIAYDVLTKGDSKASALETIPGASVSSYQAPEISRTKFRQKSQTPRSRKHTHDMLSSIRTSGGL